MPRDRNPHAIVDAVLALGITRARLARIIEVNAKTLDRWEKGNIPDLWCKYDRIDMIVDYSDKYPQLLSMDDISIWPFIQKEAGYRLKENYDEKEHIKNMTIELEKRIERSKKLERAWDLYTRVIALKEKGERDTRAENEFHELQQWLRDNPSPKEHDPYSPPLPDEIRRKPLT